MADIQKVTSTLQRDRNCNQGSDPSRVRSVTQGLQKNYNAIVNRQKPCSATAETNTNDDNIVNVSVVDLVIPDPIVQYMYINVLCIF